MIGLKERDIRSALELVYDAGGLTGPEPFPTEFLQQLSCLIPADTIVGYHEAIIGRPCRVVEVVEIPPNSVPAEIAQAAAQLLDQDPLNHDRARETRVLKLSDFLTPRQLRKLEMYRCVWEPVGVHDSLRVWLPAPTGRARMLYLERSGRDFTERDRALLGLLRPSLIKIHARAAACRRAERPADPRLTARELEILRLVADGKTSREIASALVISPLTVRKHVEHILEKLDVRTRSAAVARVFERAS